MDNEKYIENLKQYGTVTYDEDGVLHFKYKPALKECQLGCGAFIHGQLIRTKFYTTKMPHCRRKCTFCGQWELPDGGLSRESDVIAYCWDHHLQKKYGLS